MELFFVPIHCNAEGVIISPLSRVCRQSLRLNSGRLGTQTGRRGGRSCLSTERSRFWHLGAWAATLSSKQGQNYFCQGKWLQRVSVGDVIFVFMTVLHFWIVKKFCKNANLHFISGNFHEVLPDFFVFLKFYSNGLTEIENSDDAIEFYTEKSILGRIFTFGGHYCWDPACKPTVSSFIAGRRQGLWFFFFASRDPRCARGCTAEKPNWNSVEFHVSIWERALYL